MFKKIGKVFCLAIIMILSSYLRSNDIKAEAKSLVSGNPEMKTETIAKTNVDIEGRHYEFIRYVRNIEKKKIRIESLKTKEDVLVIPAKVNGEQVLEVGAGESVDGKYSTTEEGISWAPPLQWKIEEQQKLKKIVVQEGIKQILQDAFHHISADCLELPKSLTSIGGDDTLGRFEEFQIKHVIIKGKKTNILAGIFSFSGIKKITFPKNYEGKIGSSAFENSAIESVAWPSYKSGASKKIGHSLFENCKKLKKVVFPKNQAHIYIPESTFYGCTKLKKLTFPASTKKVTYRWHAYADNFKKSPQILEIKGKKTKLEGTKFEYRKNMKPLLTVSKIIVPPKSKALAYAKKAKKIKSFSKYTIKVGIQGEEGAWTNYADRTGDGLLKLTKLKYVIRK